MHISRMIKSLFILLVAVNATGVSAEIPGVMVYQGKLTASDGQPVSDGLHSLSFSIYPSETGGYPLWQEEERQVNVDQGVFTVMLGEQNSLPAEVFSGDRWLQVGVNGTELQPRTRLTSTAYSFRAHTAEHVVDEAAVKSLNSITGDVTIAAGDNITISEEGNTLLVSGQGIPSPLPVIQGGDWDVGIVGTPEVVSPALSRTVQIWDTSQTIAASGFIDSPVIDCAGFREVRIMLTTLFPYTQPENILVEVRFQTAQGFMQAIGRGNFAPAEYPITTNANFVQHSNTVTLNLPVLGDAVSLRIINQRSASIVLTTSSWIYMVN